MDILFRTARGSDAEQMVEIYRPSIEQTAASFEETVPSTDNFAARLEEYAEKFPWIVADVRGEVLGYAYASVHRLRSAYRWSAECTCYVKSTHAGRGIGKQLYGKLFPILRQQGVVNVYGGITLPNEASVRLHESMGFRKIAHYQGVGYKMGKWWDVGWWGLELERPQTPDELKDYRPFLAAL